MRLLLGQLRRRSPLSNVARNSPAATSNHELASLQLQRLWAISKTDRGKLCASFAWLGTAAAQQRGRVLLLTPVMALLPPTSTAARYRGLPRRHGNFACNSPGTTPPAGIRAEACSQFRMQFPFGYFKR